MVRPKLEQPVRIFQDLRDRVVWMECRVRYERVRPRLCLRYRGRLPLRSASRI
jgi:hypothetical protein